MKLDIEKKCAGGRDSHLTLISLLEQKKDDILSQWIHEVHLEPSIAPIISSADLKEIFEYFWQLLRHYLQKEKDKGQISIDQFVDRFQLASARSIFISQKVIVIGKKIFFKVLEGLPDDLQQKLQFYNILDNFFTEICLTSLAHFLSHPVSFDPQKQERQPASKSRLLSRLNLFYNAFQHSTDGIIITDLEGRVIEVNQAFLEIFGYEYEEVIGRTTGFLRAPETSDEFYRQMWHSINTTGEWKGEIINRKKNGELIPIWLSITPVYENGERIGYMGVEIDISEKKRIENELIKEKMFTESLIETANSLIVGLNLHGEITIFNKKLEEVTGYKKTEVLGKNWFELFLPPGVRPTAEEIFETIVQGKLPSYHEVPILTRQGEERYISWSNTPIRNENQEIIGALGIGQDITEQKRLEKQILRSERLATIGQMAAKVAHEIRNPLSSISLNAELLGDELRAGSGRISEEAEVLLKSIMSEVDRLAILTEEYLQFSRLPDADPHPADLTQLIHEVIEFVEPETSSRGIQIISELEEKPTILVFDAQQIRRVLLNIIKNAIDAMKNGGLLKIKVKEFEKFVEISISDTGEGIPENARDKIFEPFYTTKDMGTGLGLAISHQVIQEHGGKLYFNSEIGKGTTFFIQLPKSRNDNSKQQHHK